MTRKKKILKEFAQKGMMEIIESCLTKDELDAATRLWEIGEDISMLDAVFMMLDELED